MSAVQQVWRTPEILQNICEGLLQTPSQCQVDKRARYVRPFLRVSKTTFDTGYRVLYRELSGRYYDPETCPCSVWRQRSVTPQEPECMRYAKAVRELRFTSFLRAGGNLVRLLEDFPNFQKLHVEEGDFDFSRLHQKPPVIQVRLLFLIRKRDRPANRSMRPAIDKSLESLRKIHPNLQVNTTWKIALFRDMFAMASTQDVRHALGTELAAYTSDIHELDLGAHKTPSTYRAICGPRSPEFPIMLPEVIRIHDSAITKQFLGSIRSSAVGNPRLRQLHLHSIRRQQETEVASGIDFADILGKVKTWWDPLRKLEQLTLPVVLDQPFKAKPKISFPSLRLTECRLEFDLPSRSDSVLMPPTVPINHYGGS